MRVNGINSYSNVSFGYDEKLNKDLQYRLAELPDKHWAKTISDLNKFCNNCENNIRHEAKLKNTHSSQLSDYIELFQAAKEKLAGYVALTFWDLNYADREYSAYEKEFADNGSLKTDWRLKAMEALKAWVSFPVSKSEDKKDASKQLFVPEFDENGVEKGSSLVSGLNNVISQKKKTEGETSHLEQFVPTSSSPKGFSDVAGMKDLKQSFANTVIQYINNPEAAQKDFEEYGKTIPKAILLYGPPGCGKTYITQALAQEISAPMYMLNISKTGSSFINLTSKNIKAAFDEAIEMSKKSDKPCILFMDEIDSLAFDRSSQSEQEDLKQVATMLQSIDATKDANVIIVGATNKYNLLDPAIRRRFDEKVFVSVPDTEAIRELLIKTLTPMKKAQNLLASSDDIEKISNMLIGYSNSSICNITRQAALNAMDRNRADVAIEDFEVAIKNTGEEKPNIREYSSDSKRNKLGF